MVLQAGSVHLPTCFRFIMIFLVTLILPLEFRQCLAFRFKENFNFPYTSLSITEFWRRWHISLGTWFREYLYIPLGGNRKGKGRTLVNLGIVFLTTGIWHGAGWNYIWWGALNGFFMIIERLSKDKTLYKKVPNAIKWIATMVIVFFSWQLFRFPSWKILQRS